MTSSSTAGNSFYKDDIRHAKTLAEKGIRYVDCGTSGGVWGTRTRLLHDDRRPKEVVDYLDPIFAALAPGLGDIPRTPDRANGDSRAEHGYIHAGPTGAGHFVKMVHNGIEYGLMQAYGGRLRHSAQQRFEGFARGRTFHAEPADIAEFWRRGSVVSSWLLDLSAAALARDPQLKEFSGYVQDFRRRPLDRRSRDRGSGIGKCAFDGALCPLPLAARAHLREKMLSAMRFGFEGHVEGQEPIDPKRSQRPIDCTASRRVGPSLDDPTVHAPKTARVIQSPPRRQAQASRPMRDGDLRRHRRPDQASGDSGSL